MERTGILCHGRHLQANNWELHQWGDEENGKLGQILKTMHLTYLLDPEVVVFGTGASEKDGLKESEYTIKHMFENFFRLQSFHQFYVNERSVSLESMMKEKSIAETQSQNTNEELYYAGQIFLDRRVNRVIIVSNPDHIGRCMQLAHGVYSQPKFSSFEQFYGAQSEVGYDGTTTPTTRMIEMPHRGDDPSPNLAQHIGGYFGLSLERKQGFVEMVEAYLKKE